MTDETKDTEDPHKGMIEVVEYDGNEDAYVTKYKVPLYTVTVKCDYYMKIHLDEWWEEPYAEYNTADYISRTYESKGCHTQKFELNKYNTIGEDVNEALTNSLDEDDYSKDNSDNDEDQEKKKHITEYMDSNWKEHIQDTIINEWLGDFNSNSRYRHQNAYNVSSHNCVLSNIIFSVSYELEKEY
jgi:hypothetical protein